MAGNSMLVRLPSTQFQLDFINAVGVGTPAAGIMPHLSVAPESQDRSDVVTVTRGTDEQVDWQAAHAALDKLRNGFQPLVITEPGLLLEMTPAPNKTFFLFLYPDGIQLAAIHLQECDERSLPSYVSSVNWQLKGGQLLYNCSHELSDGNEAEVDDEGASPLVCISRTGMFSSRGAPIKFVVLDGKPLAKHALDYVERQFTAVVATANSYVRK